MTANDGNEPAADAPIEARVLPSDASFGGAPGLATLIMLALGGAAAFAGRTMLPLAVVLAFVGLFVGRALLTNPRKRRGSLTVTADAIEIDGEPVVARQKVTGAYVVPGSYEGLGGAVVELTRRGLPTIRLGVGSVDAARRVLAELGMDTHQRRQTFTAKSVSEAQLRIRQFVGIAAFLPYVVFRIVASAMPHGPSESAIVMAAVGAAVAALAIGGTMMSGKVDVGADGILLRWLTRRTFIPIADIESVRMHQQPSFRGMTAVLEIVRKNGPSKVIVVGSINRGRRYDEANAGVLRRADALAERIREAIADRDAAAADPVRLPARGARTADVWLADLRKVGSRDDYRADAAPDVHALFRVVEDPAKDAATRAAAAAVLGPTLDDEGRKRLRVAASASAAPKLRVALEAAAGKDDEALKEALAEIEDGEGEAAKRAS